MTTRDGHKWVVLRNPGGPYVAARSDSEYVRRYKREGVLVGTFRTMKAAVARARQLNLP